MSTRDQKLVLYGDSIASGYASVAPPLDGVDLMLRQGYAGSVAVEALSGASLFWDTGSPAAFAPVPSANLNLLWFNRLAKHRARVYYLAIGTNDYNDGTGNGTMSPANFGAVYGQGIDLLHGACPWAQIVCQSMLLRAAEGANANFGATTDDYRAEIQTVATAAGRAQWASFVNGKAILGLGDLADGLHPTDAGAAKWARSILSTLGS